MNQRRLAQRRTRTGDIGRSSRATRGLALGLAGVLLSATFLAQDTVISKASWNETEWTHGTVGTSDCLTPEGAFANRSEGRALSGELLGIDLDAIAAAEGVEVTNNGTVATPSGGSPVSGLTDAWADPLSVSALSTLQLQLTGLLELPADNSTGVVGQFAQTERSGEALGASGYITNSGGVDLSPLPQGYPDMATLKLSNLLNSPLLGDLGLGSALQDVADAELRIGAVSGQARLSGCEAIWLAAGGIAEEVSGLERQYRASELDLHFSSPTVGALIESIGGSAGETCVTPEASVLTTLECTVNGLASNAGVLGALENGIVGLLGTLTGGLGLGDIDLALTATIDTSEVRALLDDTLSDGVVTLNLSDGSIHIDTVALLSAANPAVYGNGLNELAPNTNPLSDSAVLVELTNRVSSMLANWITVVESTLDAVIDSVMLHLLVDVHLKLTYNFGSLGTHTNNIGQISAEVNCQPVGAPVAGCTLGSLLDPAQNSNATTAQFIILPGLGDIPLLGSILVSLVNDTVGALISGLVSTLVSGLGGLLGSVVEGVLGPLRTLPVTVTDLVPPVISTVSTLYNTLFGGLEPVVSLTVNAQNRTVNASDTEPTDWQSLPEGRYEVAALRIGVLDALGDWGVRLYLGRASVGPSCSLAGVTAGGCSGY